MTDAQFAKLEVNLDMMDLILGAILWATILLNLMNLLLIMVQLLMVHHIVK